jgi:hypothetical protein
MTLLKKSSRTLMTNTLRTKIENELNEGYIGSSIAAENNVSLSTVNRIKRDMRASQSGE